MILGFNLDCSYRISDYVYWKAVMYNQKKIIINIKQLRSKEIIT